MLPDSAARAGRGGGTGGTVVCGPLDVVGVNASVAKRGEKREREVLVEYAEWSALIAEYPENAWAWLMAAVTLMQPGARCGPPRGSVP